MRGNLAWCLVVVSCFVQQAAALGEEDGEATPLALVCSPDRPTVALGGKVLVKAWAASESEEPVRFTWTATAGHLTGHTARKSSEASWSLLGVEPGSYSVIVQASDAEGRFAACSARVRVLDRTRSAAARRAGSALLPRGQSEGDGYSLYSYLLFGSRPDESSRERYLATLEAFLRMVEPILELEQLGVERESLNVSYFPIKLPEEAKKTGPVFEAEWLLEHYDNARASIYLDRLGRGQLLRGPYVVSCPKGFGKTEDHSGHRHLFQDLSSVPPRVASLWVEVFLNQAAQQRYWEPRVLEQLALELRTAIEVAAIALPDVRAGVRSWIDLTSR